VFCATAQDVINAIHWAREQGIALRARSGRHSLEGWSSVDGGLVIDVSRMKSISIDHTARTATVGTGLTQLETVTALGQHGFAVPTGSEGGVGLGGVILGGGFGLLTRSMGMACDSLIAADVVVAIGERSAKLIRACEDDHSDLLWACRGGGGGNFGIATSYTFALHELSDVTFLVARWGNHDQLADLLRMWQRDAPVADEKLTSALEIDANAIELCALRHGAGRQQLLAELAPLLAIGEPELTFIEGSWPTVYREVDRGPADVKLWKFYSQFVTSPFPEEALDMIVRFMSNTPSPASNFYCTSFGGAVRQAPPGGSAFPHRDALFYCEPGAAWNDPALNSQALAWAADFWQGPAAVQRRGLRQRPQRCRRRLGTRLLRRQLPTAPSSQGDLRPGQRLQLRAKRARPDRLRRSPLTWTNAVSRPGHDGPWCWTTDEPQARNRKPLRKGRGDPDPVTGPPTTRQ